MNKFRFYFILPLLSIVLFSCTPDDEAKAIPPRDFKVQRLADLDSIESYLKTHSFSVVDEAGRIDVKIDTFIVGNTEGKVSIWENTDYPLQFKMVKSDSRRSNLVDGVSIDPEDYKMYYFIINEGGGTATTRFDSTFVSYRGWRLDNKQFEIINTPIWFTFPSLTTGEGASISGFRQFSTLLKTALSVNVGSDGGINYTDYGVGVVFLPSGLGYYDRPPVNANIPSYSPLVFTVRLHTIRKRDHDQDGILSKYENGNQVEDLYTVDTDNDRIPDFLDMDDDNDNVRTIIEIRNPATGKPFAFEEIPTCIGGTLKKHLDPSCQ